MTFNESRYDTNKMYNCIELKNKSCRSLEGQILIFTTYIVLLFIWQKKNEEARKIKEKRKRIETACFVLFSFEKYYNKWNRCFNFHYSDATGIKREMTIYSHV